MFFCVMMRTMNKSYIEKRNGGLWIAGKRVSLDSIVYAFKRGASPETIKRSFPLLTLEEVYGALTFYLANQVETERYLSESEQQLNFEAEKRRESLQKAKPELFERLKNAEVVAK
jgi:uncharacterized protein (DUF433 family)